MGIELLRYVLGALILIMLQFFLIQEVNFGTWIKPMPYILFLFTLPFSFNRFAVLLSGFMAGFILDAMSNTGGLHAASTVTMAFAKILTDEKLLDTDAIQLQGYKYLSPGYKGFRYFAVYVLALTIIHHLVYFSLDYFRFSAIPLVLIVTILSSAATFGLLLLYRITANLR